MTEPMTPERAEAIFREEHKRLGATYRDYLADLVRLLVKQAILDCERQLSGEKSCPKSTGMP